MRPWCQTRNLNLATALATCGVDFNIEKILDEPTGARSCWFIMATTPVERPGDPNPLRFSTPKILQQIRDHTLEQSDPAHPVLDCLHGISIRESLLSWLKRGHRCRIVPIVGTERAVAEAGSEEALPVGDLVRTPDINLAAALMRCGFPCVGIEPGLRAKFLIKNEGHHPGRAAHIAAGIRSGELSRSNEDHPALWVMMALRNRSGIMGMLKRNEELILLRDPKSVDWRRSFRSAVIFSNANSKALDQVREHLRV